MAHVLIMPRQGNTVESCIIIEWKKQEGDAVTEETALCEVETDKATFEVPAGSSGTILKILHANGDDVPVLQPIAVIGNAGEDWQAAVTQAGGDAVTGANRPEQKALSTATETAEKPAVQVMQAVAPPPAAAGTTADGFTPISPRARNKAFAEAVDISAVHGSGPDGRIIEADIDDVLRSRAPLTIAAKEALKASGAHARVPANGSGIGGRVTRADMVTLSAPVRSAAAQTAAATSAEFASSSPEFEDNPIKGIRKVIAEKMCQSLATTAQFTLNSSANAQRIQELRKHFKESKPEMGVNNININDLILFAASRMLPKYPYMNAHKLGSTLRTFNTVHLGMAVDTPRGLMVPVIRNAERLTLLQISSRAKQLAAACLDGSIKPDQLSGSTLTVSNMGNTGIESFTPVINIPEVAILGVCGIQPKAVQKLDGSCAFEPHISFSLTIDHAVVDGAPAAKFLKAFCEAVASIDVLLAQ